MNSKKNKKINWVIGLVAASCFALSIMAAMAADLSEQTISQCVNYLNKPSAQTENATALQACYNNYFCTQYKQADKIQNCSDNLDHWFEDYTPPQPIEKETPPVQKTIIPQEFHSTEQSTAPVETPAPAVPETQPTVNQNEQTQTKQQAPQQQQQPEKNKKPSINWF